jgi:dTDP-4-dehydrorhamnose 3,5-epimerase-like enzyme
MPLPPSKQKLAVSIVVLLCLLWPILIWSNLNTKIHHPLVLPGVFSRSLTPLASSVLITQYQLNEKDKFVDNRGEMVFLGDHSQFVKSGMFHSPEYHFIMSKTNEIRGNHVHTFDEVIIFVGGSDVLLRVKKINDGDGSADITEDIRIVTDDMPMGVVIPPGVCHAVLSPSMTSHVSYISFIGIHERRLEKNDEATTECTILT